MIHVSFLKIFAMALIILGLISGVYSSSTHIMVYGKIQKEPKMSDWPMYMHDAQHTGVSLCSGPHSNPHVVWKLDISQYAGIPRRFVFYTPLIYRNYLVMSSVNDALYLINVTSLTVDRIVLGTGEVSISKGVIYYAEHSHVPPPLGKPIPSHIYALDEKGNILWTFEYNGTSSPPIIGDDGKIYVVEDIIYPNGSLYVLTSSGDLEWKYNLSGLASPAIDKYGRIYVSDYDREILFSFDPDGSVRWSVKLGGILRAPSIDADGTIYVSAGEAFYAISPDGKVRWKVDNLYLSTVAIGSDAVYGVNVKYLYAISKDGKILWKFKPEGLTPGLYDAPPVLDKDGIIYLTDEAGYVYALKPSGELLWKFRVSNESITTSAVIGGNGTLYVATIDGTLYAIGEDVNMPVSGEEDGEKTSGLWWFYALLGAGGVMIAAAAIYYIKEAR